jgi:hypothetical protein
MGALEALDPGGKLHRVGRGEFEGGGILHDMWRIDGGEN